MSANDQVLLQQWVQGRDAEAFRLLAMRHAAMVYNTSRRILHDPTEAEDVAQECFEALVRAGDKPGAYLGAWLHRVATNLSFNRIEARRRRRTREDRFAENATPATQPYDQDLYAQVDKAIAALPDKLRYPLVAHFLENQTHDAIAESVGVSRQAVTYRIAQSIERVRATLKRRGVIVAAAGLTEFLHATSSEAVPARLAANLGRLAVAGSSAASMGLTLTAVSGILPIKALLTAAVIIVAGLALLLTFGLKQDTRPPSRSGPPPIPKAVRVKLDEMAGQPAPVSPPQNRPVLAVLPPKPEQRKPLTPAVVWGTVASTEGEPLSNAQVELHVGPNVRLGGEAEATFISKTDREGKYKITGITVFGDARLGAFAQGFAGGWSSARDNREGHWPYLPSLEPGTEYAEKDFKLPPALSQITGRVVNTARQPIPGAWVVVQDQEYEEHSRADGANAAFTDAEGRFAIDLPNDEDSVVEVYKKGYATGYFPWTKSNARDLVLVLEAGGALVGHVSNLQGNPVPRLTVQTDAINDGKRAQNVWEAPSARQAVTNDQGDYRFNDLPVAYEYQVVVPWPIPEPIAAEGEQGKTLSSFLLLQEKISRDVQDMRLGLASGRLVAKKTGPRKRDPSRFRGG